MPEPQSYVTGHLNKFKTPKTEFALMMRSSRATATELRVRTLNPKMCRPFKLLCGQFLSTYIGFGLRV